MKIFTDNISRILYSTDASAYKEMPYGVCYPENETDIIELTATARKLHTSIIPRTAGTSIAGQVVGKGIVADVSKHMNRILEINAEQRWVRVQPGVVRDELNMALKPYGLLFGPETATSSRCCIGGMVGNNSCGTHSLIYGSTRDHLIEAKVILSDGSRAVFSSERALEMTAHLQESTVLLNGNVTLEEKIYAQLLGFSMDGSLKKEIENEFPDPSLRRRNTGYALDMVLGLCRPDESILPDSGTARDIDNPIQNICRLLAGSEGTLAFAYEFKLNLVKIDPVPSMLLCIHTRTLENAFKANLTALKHHPRAVELIDDKILELSSKNPIQSQNRFFIDGEPAAIAIAELPMERDGLCPADALEKELTEEGLAYACTRVYSKDIPRVWALRKAGLGLLNGMKGSAKPAPVIEDTAVAPERLPEYIADFKDMLSELGLECVYYAHISTGELHLRPILNLKESEGRRLFHCVAERTARLVKKHHGSLSGEHGDGRLRGEFIPIMYGEHIYSIFEEIKRTWDPDGIFNPGKITDTPPMNDTLRYEENQHYPPLTTYFNFDDDMGIFCSIEQCNGSADCRRSAKFPGTLCPSYRAGKEEKYSTRARANILRQLLTNPADPSRPFDSPEIKELLDTCLSCKGCRAECPSNVDMTRFKAEFMQHWHDIHGVPFRTWCIAHISFFLKLGAAIPHLYNLVAGTRWTSSILKKIIGFAPQRQIPLIGKNAGAAFHRWVRRHGTPEKPNGRRVYLLADEFTAYTDTDTGRDFVTLLTHLGYEILIPRHYESGRAGISKGLVKNTARLALKNVIALKDIITADTPLVGLEPSAILSFRDEYPDLVPKELKGTALLLAKNCLLYDEFLVREFDAGRITREMFGTAPTSPIEVFLHGHCHQKSLVGIGASEKMLNIPGWYNVNVIPSACCGMAGSFGYEKEHYDFSMSVGEQTLFPALQRLKALAVVAAPGTSCRTQIFDATGIKAV
ncbi:MAG: FAD-binding protein, partial [Alistipes sp.]|nr:FAD-binding protein [Candidatus Minthomonas equi]